MYVKKFLLTESEKVVIICVYNIDTDGYWEGEQQMNICIIGESAIPLYEQITNQIKEQVLKGEIEQGSALPSIRMMAKELKVSIITVKRAYEDLEQEGFVETVPGKGTYISLANKERLREMRISQIEEQIEEIVTAAKSINMSLNDIQDRVRIIYEEG